MGDAPKRFLGVNVDHVATLRNARGGRHPDPLDMARLAVKSGADGITAHLREDRRHIRDDDIQRLSEKHTGRPLHLEMAATEEMMQIALQEKPSACCFVPEKREELTTEGGLDVVAHEAHLASCVKRLKAAGIRVSFFIDPDIKQLEATARAGADIAELHTGSFCAASDHERQAQRNLLREAAAKGAALGLEMHAGHALDFETAREVAAIPSLSAFHVGHFLIGESIALGLEEAVRRMAAIIEGSGGRA